MAIPHRGWTSNSTYFVTASAFDKKHLFQSEQMAGLLTEVLLCSTIGFRSIICCMNSS